MYTPQERFGVGVNLRYGDITDYDIASLRVGWYLDWDHRINPPRPTGIEYAQLIYVAPSTFPPDWTALGEVIRANPGSMWFVGNEPDGAPGVQDSQLPETYARAYHEVYTFIKAQDPTARVGPGGVIQPTPIRLQYLDLVLAAHNTQYGTTLPADFWGTHVQILQEKRGDWGAGIPPGVPGDAGRLYSIQDNANPDIFEQLVWELRTWMATRNLRDMPLIISEYGVLMPSLYLCYCLDRSVGDAMVLNFMTRTFDFLLTAKDPDIGYPADENRLVQRWAWYSLNEKPYDVEPWGTGFNGGLFDWRYPHYPGVLTIFGQHFQRYTSILGFKPYHHILPTIAKAQ